MQNIQRILNHIYLKRYWFVYGLILTGFATRIITLKFFPHFITEDSYAYFLASKFFDTNDNLFRDYWGYRQFLYPVIISFAYKLSTLPIFLIASIQAFFVSFSGYILFRILLYLRVNFFQIIIAVGYISFSHLLIRYSVAIAPEALIFSLLVISSLLLTIQFEKFSLHNYSMKIHAVLLFIQALILYCLSFLKEQFVLYAIITYAIYLVILIYNFLPLKKNFRIWVLYAVSGFILSGAALGTFSYSRNMLNSKKLNPTCFPWVMPIACYFTDLNTNTHLTFKNKARPYILINQKRIQDWNFSFNQGNAKVNQHCFESLISQAMLDYTYEIEPDITRNYGYETMCAMEKAGAPIVFEGIRNNFVMYMKNWYFVEMYRGFFPLVESSPRFDEEHKGTSIRFLMEEDKYNFSTEFKNLDLYKYLDYKPTYERELFARIKGNFNSRLPKTHIVYSYMFIFGIFIFLFLRGWRFYSFYQNIFILHQFIYMISIMSIMAGVGWLYERYFLYYIFSLIVVGSAFFNTLWLSFLKDIYPKIQLKLNLLLK